MELAGEWVKAHPWIERFDEATHHLVPWRRVHRVFFGWACDLLDLSYGCPLDQLWWPSNRFWRFVAKRLTRG